MSRRLEIELTSERPDGTWTWRAAGAKQPKGELSASVLPAGAKVGDVVRADADFAIDGIEIINVLPPKAARKEPELLAVVGTRQDEPLVTTQLVEKRGRRDDDRRGPRRDRGERGDRGPRGDRGGRDRPGGDRPRSDRPRGPRPDPVPERPKPKRLRPGRQHRAAVLDTLPVEHRPIAEQVLRGGVPAVREAITKQNEQAKAENRPEIPADQLVALAEQLLPGLRAAEWRDRADAALADLDELDLRDLRSVIVAADGVVRDDESLAIKDQIQEGLTRRIEEEQTLWISDITANLDGGRFVRALRLSSRPPKAGAPLPVDVSSRLVSAVSEGLTPTVNQDLWAAAVDALAFSPVRGQVVPAGRPEEPSPALLDAVRRVGDRLPKIVELFGLDPAEVAAAAKKRGRGGARGGRPGQGNKPKGGGNKGGGDKADRAPKADEAPAAAAAAEPSVADAEVGGIAPEAVVEAEVTATESTAAEATSTDEGSSVDAVVDTVDTVDTVDAATDAAESAPDAATEAGAASPDPEPATDPEPAIDAEPAAADDSAETVVADDDPDAQA
jgi:hypothetical protein